MATMRLYFSAFIESVTVHADNDYYPQEFNVSGKFHDLKNLPSSGNIWIVPDEDVVCVSGYTTPINITTQNPTGSWKLDNDNYVKIVDGRSITLTPTKDSGGGGGGTTTKYNITVDANGGTYSGADTLTVTAGNAF